MPINFRQVNRLLNVSTRTISLNLQNVRNAHTKLPHKLIGKLSSAPHLVILHSLYGPKDIFDAFGERVVQKAIPHRIVVVVDLREYGLTSESCDYRYTKLNDEINNLLRDLGLKKVALLGHSLAGTAVIKFTLKYPHLVERLIIVDMSVVIDYQIIAYHLKVLKLMKSVKLPAPETPLEEALRNIDKQLSAQIKDPLFRDILISNLRHSKERYYWRLNIEALVDTFYKYVPISLLGDQVYKGPTLFIAGANSEFIKESHHRQIVKTFPNSTMKFVHRSVNLVPAENPEAFFALCMDFLNKT